MNNTKQNFSQYLSPISFIVIMLSIPATNANTDYNGTWSGIMTTQQDLYWNSADYLCFPGCPTILHDHLSALLADPANDSKPTDELVNEAFNIAIEDRTAISTLEGLKRIEASINTENVDMAKFCEPYGFVREALNALPLRISQQAKILEIDYEEFNLHRTIYMDGRDHPINTPFSPLGFSTAHFDEDVLVIETSHLSSDYFIALNSPTIHYGSYADGTKAVERYTIIKDPKRLVLDLTIIDPITLKHPYQWTKTWLYTPKVELLVDSCVDVPGQF